MFWEVMHEPKITSKGLQNVAYITRTETLAKGDKNQRRETVCQFYDKQYKTS